MDESTFDDSCNGVAKKVGDDDVAVDLGDGIDVGDDDGDDRGFLLNNIPIELCDLEYILRRRVARSCFSSSCGCGREGTSQKDTEGVAVILVVVGDDDNDLTTAKVVIT